MLIIKEKLDEPVEKSLNINIIEKNLAKQADDAKHLFSLIQNELNSKQDGDFKEGLSFLDLKNDLLLSYMIDICNIILRKARGQKIEGHESIQRSIECRVIIEKLKTIDQRLSYQLNKLITRPVDADEEVGERMNIQNLDIDVEDDDEDDDDDDDDEEDDDVDDEDKDEGDDDDDNDGANTSKKMGKDAKYKPPKLRSVKYDDGHGGNDHDDEDSGQESRRMKRQIRFEEENYTRLPEKSNKKKRLPERSSKKKRRKK